jgi:hypothetical protein
MIEARLESTYRSAIELAEVAAQQGMGDQVTSHLAHAARIRQAAQILADASERGPAARRKALGFVDRQALRKAEAS